MADNEFRLDYKALLEAVDGIVWEADPETLRFRYVSRQAERLLGYPVEQWLKDPGFWQDHIHPEDRHWVPETCRRETEARRSHEFEYRMIAADGRVVWLHDACGMEIENGQVVSLHGVMVDVTARVRAEEARRDFEVEAQQRRRLESLGVLAAGVSHGFNNLLASVLGNADLLLADLAEGSESHVRVERIRRAATHAAKLSRQILVNAGAGEHDARLLDLSALVQEAADLLIASISKQAEIVCELTEGLPLIRGDAAQLIQVVLNLVVNAVESFGGRGGNIRLRTGIESADGDARDPALVCEPPASVFLEVSDTGPGMDEALQSRIFDPFFTTKFAGRGLGLATTLGIVRSGGGTVRVTSKLGCGACFRVVLPAAAAGSARIVEPPERDGAWRGSGTILVVDDEPDVREVAQQMLERLGFTVALASCGKEAVAWMRRDQGSVAAVLLDLIMPEMEGGAVARQIAALRPETPIVLISGYREEHARARIPDGVRATFLQKPFSGRDLARVLSDLIPAT